MKHQTTTSRLYTELEIYLDQLDHWQSSINTGYKYNSPEKAQELAHYYSQRPGLAQYTIEKELPRMEYTVLLKDDTDEVISITDKAAIAAVLAQNDVSSLLGRCANQSLLAGLLQVLTGPDLLVRPELHATAVARSVHFVLDYTTHTVQARAVLDLSLPTEHGRWKIAEVVVDLTAANMQQQHHAAAAAAPFVKYRVEAVRPTHRDGDRWEQLLQGAVRLLAHESASNFRIYIWQDIDSMVGGVQSKDCSVFPYFAPSGCEPTSIFGGFEGSGLSKLAQPVAGEDPWLYQSGTGGGGRSSGCSSSSRSRSKQGRSRHHNR